MAESQRNTKRNKLIALIVAVVLLGLFVYSVQDWHQIWKIVSAPDNIPIVAMLFLVPFFTWLGIKQARANDRRLGSRFETRQNTSPESRTVAAGLGQGAARLAVSGAHRISGGRHRNGHFVCLVDYAERAARRAFESESNDESVEGAVVLPRPAGDARLFRSVDRGRGHALDHHDRIDGVSLRRFESARQRLLHVEAETVCGKHVRLGISDVDPADFYRHVYSRPRLDLVLARADLGPQHRRL